MMQYFQLTLGFTTKDQVCFATISVGHLLNSLIIGIETLLDFVRGLDASVPP